MIKSTRSWIPLCGVLITIGLMGWVLNTSDLEKIKNALSQTRADWFMFGLISLMGTVWIQAYRWSLCIRQPHTVQAGTFFYATLISMFFNNFLPAMIGGDIYRTSHIKNQIPLKATVQSLVVTRITNLWGAMLLPAIAVGFSPSFFLQPSWAKWVFAGSLTIWGMTLFHPLLPPLYRWMLEKTSRPRLQSGIRILLNLVDHRTFLLKAILSSWLLQATIIWAHVCFSNALGLPLTFLDLFFLTPTVLVLTTLPISFNGIGVRENAYVFTLAYWGIHSEFALAYSLLSFSGTLIISLIGGVGFIVTLIKKTSTL